MFSFFCFEGVVRVFNLFIGFLKGVFRGHLVNALSFSFFLGFAGLIGSPRFSPPLWLGGGIPGGEGRGGVDYAERGRM